VVNDGRGEDDSVNSTLFGENMENYWDKGPAASFLFD
jgi:hypothetical protein